MAPNPFQRIEEVTPLENIQAHDNGIFNLPVPFRGTIRGKALSCFCRGLEKIFFLRHLNDIYTEIPEGQKAGCFIDEALKRLDIGYDTIGAPLSDIPRQGPLVIVANHPFGGIEGLLLGSIMLGLRDDTKIMANYFLGRIPELRDILFCVDPFKRKGSQRKNLRPLREVISWLENGHALVVFPAGTVSYFDVLKRQVIDPLWNENIARIIRKSHASVIPVFFDGANSPLFQLAGMIHSRLRTALLPFELANKKSKRFNVRIGRVLPFKKLDSLGCDQKLVEYIRMRTYALQYRRLQTTDKGDAMVKEPKNNYREQVIAPGPPNEIVATEVEKLPAGQVLIRNGEYVVAHARAHQAPNLLFEIGRLRETTFRAAGEGTGKPVDLDRFDLYYNHLFVWDAKHQHVVGAYRMGQVDIINERFGKKGLYTNKLFDLSGDFLKRVESGIELGRSFVRPEYQKLYAPLLLLWKGIGHFVALNPNYRMLFGPVSISDTYSALSRELMVLYLTVNHYAPDLASLIKPRAPMRGKEHGTTRLEPIVKSPTDIEDLSLIISDIESDQKGIPVLLKQYIKMGGKLMGFNIDRSFSNVLDGLIMVDLVRCDKKILDRYMGDEGAQRFLAYHQPRPQHLAS